MLKHIFKQLWRRRGANVWTGLELLIVFGLVWFMVDYFFVIAYNYNLPDYWNGKHAWQINIAEYPLDHPDYSEAENTKQAKLDNTNRLIRLFASQPGVEHIAASFWGSTPGEGSYMGSGFRLSGDTASNPVGGQVITFDPAFDYFRTFAYSQQNGKRPISVSDFDFSNPKGIILSQAAAKRLFPDGDDPVGKEIVSGDHKHPESMEHYIVTGLIDDTKRFPYRRPEVKFYREQRMDTTLQDWPPNISIRSSAAIADSRFVEDFRTKMLVDARSGNFYFKSITPFSKILDENEKQFGVFNEILTRVVLMTFFLLNIILCVVGTFWYRVNARREETGIRKALGSTQTGIRNLFLLEGLCLLCIAALLAMVAEYQFVSAGMIETMGRGNLVDDTCLTDRTIPRFLITNGITWLIMAAVISAAIWIPARRAAAMQAADALHYE